MTIPKGTRLGPYEIDRQIGAGGMGAVYLARDSRLERQVAIKILPSSFASNPQFLARFEREARTISSLSHPNICVLHDVGKTDLPSNQIDPDSVSLSGDVTVHYIVMEYLEGDSLADRLEHGPLPLHEVLRIGRQIADALDKAHRQGIVHRDLKPGNVMLTKSGAKLLDFGLAKAGSGISENVGASQATVAKPLTQEGTIVGTFQYMSPEQLEGLEADPRTDIFALGCVLYEMATGRRAFQGETRTSLIAAIVTGEPQPISELQPMTPPALEHVIRKCLSKDPDNRWQSARDVFLELEWASEAGSHAGLAKAVASVRRTRIRLVTALAVLGWIVAAVTLAWLATRGGVPEARETFHASVVPDGLPSSDTVVGGSISLSPDGTKLLYTTQDRPSRESSGRVQRQIGVYDFRTGKSQILEGTAGAAFAFWSPDGRWIGFFQGEKLRKIEASGGPVQTLTDAHDGRGGTWSPNGMIVFAPDIQGALLKVPENGGRAEPVTTTSDPQITHRNPSFLPDGETFLFVSRNSQSEAVGRTMLGALSGGEPREILNPGSNTIYASGRLFFVRDRNLLSQPFDLKTGEPVGSIIPVAEAVSYFNPRDIGDFSVSQNGIVVYRKESPVTRSAAWFNRDGKEIRILGEPMSMSSPAVSRDQRKLAFARGDEKATTWDVWILDTEKDQLSRATFLNATFQPSVAFSPDGGSIVVSTLSAAGGWAANATWIQPVSGTRTDEVLLESSEFFPTDWSPDGKVLVGRTQRTETGFDITWLEIDDPDKTIHDLVQTRFDENDASMSPDGNWVVYMSDETGKNEVYVVDFPEARTKRQVSNNGGSSPTWSQSGDELYFGSPDGIMAAPVAFSGRSIEIGTPARMPLGDADLGPPIAGDGNRFLMLKTVGGDVPNPIYVVQNWAIDPKQ